MNIHQWFSITSYQTGARDFVFAILSVPSHYIGRTGPYVVSLDEKVQKVADADPEFAAALQRQKGRELEEAKLICSLDNKEACLMCSG